MEGGVRKKFQIKAGGLFSVLFLIIFNEILPSKYQATELPRPGPFYWWLPTSSLSFTQVHWKISLSWGGLIILISATSLSMTVSRWVADTRFVSIWSLFEIPGFLDTHLGNLKHKLKWEHDQQSNSWEQVTSAKRQLSCPVKGMFLQWKNM